MAKYVYSNCIGTYVFDNDTKIEETLFSKEEVMKNYPLLEKGEILDTEKQFLEKYKNAEILGKDGSAIKPAIMAFFNTPEHIKKLNEFNLIITKRKVADSLRPDHLIIQAVNNIDEIDKVGNTLARRLREWYELYNPEFSHSIESNEKFAELIVAKSRDELWKEIGQKPSESMGAELAEKDVGAILDLAKEFNSLYALKERQLKYIESAVQEIMPNVTHMTGAMIAAKLLAIAGSLEKIVLFPASTIQLLGAEKALFRHIKTGARSPKYGVIINHPLVASAKPSKKGKVARMLADKISIAAKVDYFKGEFCADKLLKELTEKVDKI